ncbi:Fic family protein [Neisseria dumasiana]|uniref:Cell filamentation protein Fic n=1 Tax=Neisseria dumasiana TaxID=1931275 RepID=A0ABX3WN02_9NEIS|nr:Fic family protein [Neisseria dumasiana]OSI36130.1 cell filamentation protein Fic [Neisseria dumasiana]UOO83503.1 Fic family protein [Neisseria dumasiana]
MKISTPPKFALLQQEYVQHLTEKMTQTAELINSAQNNPNMDISDFLPEIKDYSEFSVTDESGKYLHWDKFRWIHKEDTRMKWRAVKESRRKIQKPIDFPFEHQFWFCIPDSLQARLHLIDKSCGSNIGTSSLGGFGRSEQNRFLLKSLIMEEAITSAQLEGAATTRKVAKDMLKSQRKPKTKDEIMIVNNYHLMKKAVELKHTPLSIEIILDLHRIATSNAIENRAEPGQFRQDDEIFIADTDGNSLYQPPPYGQVYTLMEAVCTFANNTYDGAENPFIHPVVQAIILHFLIGYIHPFGDGNGRTARALFYWFMLKNGYWLFEYISISRLLKNAPAQYAKSYLYAETDDLDLTYFIYYQCDIIKRAVVDLENYISDKQKHQQQFKAAIAKYTEKIGKLNQRQIGILQKAVEESGKIFTAQEIANQYGVSLNTARSDLSKLGEYRFLVPFKSGNALEYVAPQDLLERLGSGN